MKLVMLLAMVALGVEAKSCNGKRVGSCVGRCGENSGSCSCDTSCHILFCTCCSDYKQVCSDFIDNAKRRDGPPYNVPGEDPIHHPPPMQTLYVPPSSDPRPPPTDGQQFPKFYKMRCQDPGPIDHGSHSGGGQAFFAVGETITYSCDQGYHMSGLAVRTCKQKLLLVHWSPEAPKCRESFPSSCRRIVKQFHGDFTGKKEVYDKGDSVTFFCDAGYTLLGPEVIYCDGSAWAAVEPKCLSNKACDGVNCGSHAVCEPTEDTSYGEGYHCVCQKGYADKHGGGCMPQSPCDHNPCSQHATCRQVGDSYACDCVPGYRKDVKQECMRVLPCDIVKCHEQATCRSLNHTHYECRCHAGYRGNGIECHRMLPCEVVQCHEKAMCRNLNHTHYECNCKDGYEGNGKECSPTTVDPCSRVDCPPLSTCTAEGGSAICRCVHGYQLGPKGECVKDSTRCGQNPCDANADCLNIEAVGYRCVCRPGYVPLENKCIEPLPPGPSCKGKCGDVGLSNSCSCDYQCKLTKRCCLDYDKECNL